MTRLLLAVVLACLGGVTVRAQTYPSPILGDTTLTTTKPQGFVFAAPAGGNGPPSFRALVASDLPLLGGAATLPLPTADGNAIVGYSGAFASLSATNMQIAKMTDAAVGPGVGSLNLTVIAGTAGGSCKLIARAGTSAVAVTIADNVGTGC